jgi:hypothetical protein
MDIKQLILANRTIGKADGGRLTRLLRPLHGTDIPKISGELKLDAHLAYHGLSKLICKNCGRDFMPTTLPVPYIWDDITYGCGWACTTKLRHGFTSPFEQATVHAKKTATVLARYGVANVYASPHVKAKIAEQNMANFGVKAPMQAERVREKARETYRTRYGIDWVFSHGPIREKIHEAWLARYGNYHGVTIDSFEKANQTRLAAYGNANPCTAPGAREKALQANRTRCLVDFPTILTQCGFELAEPLNSVELLAHGKATQRLKHTCGNISSLPVTVTGRVMKQCIHCKPISMPEAQLYQFVRQYADVEQHDRTLLKPLELDIIAPQHKLAFELNGVYWHHDGVIPIDYHRKKTELCEAKGWSLMHIFDHEWYAKQALLKSVIKTRLGIIEHVIGARKLQLAELTRIQAQEFFNTNHLQGFINGTTHLGLLVGEQIIMAMTLGKKRFSRKGELEIYRQATRRGYVVSGGLQKLLGEVKRRFAGTKLVTFVDRRFFTGKSYLSAGFMLVGKTNPNYWYYKKGVLLNRLAAQRKMLPVLLGEGYDDTLTEDENMEVNGWYRLADSGNLKLELML